MNSKSNISYYKKVLYIILNKGNIKFNFITFDKLWAGNVIFIFSMYYSLCNIRSIFYGWQRETYFG